jgi:hypothetical protein
VHFSCRRRYNVDYNFPPSRIYEIDIRSLLSVVHQKSEIILLFDRKNRTRLDYSTVPFSAIISLQQIASTGKTVENRPLISYFKKNTQC